MKKDYKLSFQEEIRKRLVARYNTGKMKFIVEVLFWLVGNIILYLFFVFVTSAEVARRYILEFILGLIAVDVIIFIGRYVYIAWYKISEEIYIEQRKFIEDYLPENLFLDIRRVPGGTLQVGNKSIQCVSLQISSNESRKIVELLAILNFEHLYYDSTKDSVYPHGFQTNKPLLWTDGNDLKEEIELRPNTLKILPICELLPTKEPKGGTIALMTTSKSVDTSSYFMEEAIYRVTIDFQGKLEGEYKFRSLRHEDVFYTKPSNQRILFLDEAEKAYKDIPAKLLKRNKALTIPWPIMQ